MLLFTDKVFEVKINMQLNIMPFYLSKSRQSCHSRSKISLLCTKQGERMSDGAMGYELHLTELAQGENDHCT